MSPSVQPIDRIMTNNQTKWTPEEDQLLREGVRKYGILWEAVKASMKDLRSVNSIIKRWHGSIKYEAPMRDVRERMRRYPKPQQERNPEPSQQSPSSSGGGTARGGVVDKVRTRGQREWTEGDDKKVKLLVVESGVLDWKVLAAAVETGIDETKLRWRDVIYPKLIKNTSTVGAALKWSILEDKILNFGQKQGIDWEEKGRCFLPHRTMGSIEARWRRVAKNFEAKETIQNKHLALKEFLRRIARRQREAESVPTRMLMEEWKAQT